MHTKFLAEILKGRDHFEELGRDGRPTLRLILKKQGVRIHLAKDKVQWQDLVNMVVIHKRQ